MLILNSASFLLAYRRRYAFRAWHAGVRPGEGG
jgi:hypothetical protein